MDAGGAIRFTRHTIAAEQDTARVHRVPSSPSRRRSVGRLPTALLRALAGRYDHMVTRSTGWQASEGGCPRAGDQRGMVRWAVRVGRRNVRAGAVAGSQYPNYLV